LGVQKYGHAPFMPKLFHFVIHSCFNRFL
jgi:hypothetical protein